MGRTHTLVAAIAILLFLFVGFNSEPFITKQAHAQGDVMTATFQVGEPQVCEIAVYFSWDGNSWKVGERRETGLSLEVWNLNPQMSDAKVYVKYIEVWLHWHIGQDGYHGHLADETYNLPDEGFIRDLGNEPINSGRSFPLTFSVSEMNPTPENSIYMLVYDIRIIGKWADGRLEEVLTNNGPAYQPSLPVRFVDDPVLITIEKGTSFPWLYVGAAVAIGLGGSTAAVFVYRRRKHRSTH